MAELKIVQFCLFILLMIFSTQAMDVRLSDGIGGFDYSTDIYIERDWNERAQYAGCDVNRTFEAGNLTTKVIVYIRRYYRMTRKTLLKRHIEKREHIADTLRAHNYELLYLAACKLDLCDRHILGEFLLRAIKKHPSVEDFEILTIGEEDLDVNYSPLYELSVYVEQKNIFDENLRLQLERIA